MTRTDTLSHISDLSRAFRALGRDFTAGMLDGFARDIESGMPAALYYHWIREHDEKLFSLVQEKAA